MSKEELEKNGNGKPPEQLGMMSEGNFDSDGKVKDDEEEDGVSCGVGPFKPPFLQRFANIWTFTIFVGLSSIASEFMQIYLKTQVPMLRRQFELKASTTPWMVYSSEIACLVSVVFLSIFARKIHIPRILALTSAVCGLAGILCVVPYLATKGDLVPPPKVLENETYSLEKFLMLAPVCTGGPRTLQGEPQNIKERPVTQPPCEPETVTKIVTKHIMVTPPATPAPPITWTIMSLPIFKKLKEHPLYAQIKLLTDQSNVDLDALSNMGIVEQLTYLKSHPPEVRTALGSLKVFLGKDADSYYREVVVDGKFFQRRRKRSADERRFKRAPGPGDTIEIPDFKKLKTHPNYAMLVQMSKTVNVDLEALAEMDLKEQLLYLDKLPPAMRSMLPQLKTMLGENADSYFIHVKIPSLTTPTAKKEGDEAEGEGLTIRIPDFKKLTTHPQYSTLVTMSKTMNIDLEALAKMDSDAQIAYLQKLPAHVMGMLPQLKSFLGPDADSYFIDVKVPIPTSSPAIGEGEGGKGDGLTVNIPDFKKLTTHPKYPTLVTMSKTMNIDLEALAKMDLDDQIAYLQKLPAHVMGMLPQLKNFLGPNADSYFIDVKVKPPIETETNSEKATPKDTQDTGSSDGELTVQIPDFKKLKTHPKFGMLVKMSKQMGIDLEGLAEMDVGGQLEHLSKLPPHVRDMLPQLKQFLGENADSYFITIKVPLHLIRDGKVEIPNFKKLKTHPKYATLVQMSKPMNIDLESLAEMDLNEQIDHLLKLPPHVQKMLPQLKQFLGSDANSYFIIIKVPPNMMPRGQEKSLEIPNFKKLKTHPKYATLVQMSKPMNIDLESLAEMDLDEQIEYLQTLPPHIQDMLPQLKQFLGSDADSYFITVKVKDSSSSEGGGSSAPYCMSMSEEVFEGIYANICPFNTGPFVVNSSTGVLSIINLAMVLQGIARAPRMAFGVTFLGDNTKEYGTALPLGILYGVTFFGPVVSLMLGFAANTMYITDDDIGYMTFFNPRWLAAWWSGFVVMVVLIVTSALPLIFFPKTLRNRPTKTYTLSEKRFKFVGYFNELGKSLFRVIRNPLYLALILGHILSAFAWTGISSVLINYVTHQFSLAPIIPGMILTIVFTIFGAIGIFLGGILSMKFKLSSVGNLKLAFALACGLVVIQLFQIGFGCNQPTVDSGNKIVSIHSNTTCGCSCQCIDHVYMPGCGSDGMTYSSPCHAGCTDKGNGQFKDCQCINDDIHTLTPGYCPTCGFFFPFAIAFCIGGILTGIQFVPLLIATFRGVHPKDIPIAVGLRTMLFIAIVVLLSPIAYQTIQDGVCIRKLPECGIMDPCVLYSIEPFRHKVFGLSIGLEVAAALFLLMALLIGRRPSSFYNGQKSYRESTI